MALAHCQALRKHLMRSLVKPSRNCSSAGGKNFLEWLNSGTGVLLVGGKLHEELNNTQAKLWLEAEIRSGIASREDRNEANARTVLDLRVNASLGRYELDIYDLRRSRSSLATSERSSPKRPHSSTFELCSKISSRELALSPRSDFRLLLLAPALVAAVLSNGNI